MLEGLNAETVRGLASLKPHELRAFARVYAKLPASERPTGRRSLDESH